MKLRTKLLLAQAPLLAALVAIAIVASLTARTLGDASRHILRDNFRSVLAAQRMKEAVERMDSGALFLVAGERERGLAQAESSQRVFEDELGVQENNVTEPGEADATRALRATWSSYRASYERLASASEPGARRAVYFDDVLPAFEAVKQGADRILALNQDAIVRKSDAAERSAARLNGWMIGFALLGALLGVAGSGVLTARLLRPLAVLGHVARRIGEGDPEARARVEGEDEIARLAGEFNTMAERLARYRQSTLGELLAAHRASQAVIDSLPDPVVVVGVQGQVLHLNESAQRLLRIRIDEGLASAGGAAHAVLERVRAHVAGGKGAYQPKGLEDAVRIATGEGERRFLPRGTAVYSEHGDVVASTVVLQDVTRLLSFEDLRTNLVATVAHEFRTPLTSLHMAIHLLTEAQVGALTEKQADLVYAAREDCERLQSIVDELLDLSRIQAGRMELRAQPLELEALARRALELARSAAEQRDVELRSEIVPGLGQVLADPDRIQIVLANLLANAIRHSPAGAAVSVRAGVERGRARVEVVDRGPGVPREYRQAVFEKYFRLPDAAPGGAGLGLFIVREIAIAHGGDVGVDDGPDGGSIFWFTLPLATG